METLKDIEFTKQQQELLCSIINVFGLGFGDHPYADDDTLPYFTKDFVKKLLECESFIEAQSNLTNDGVKYLAEIKELLN